MKLKIPLGLHDLVAEAALAAPISIQLPSPARANFILRYAQAVRNESAILSLSNPDSLNFALGAFPFLLLRADGSSILVEQMPELQLTPLIALLAGALGRIETYELPSNANLPSFRGGLSKAKQKLIKMVHDPLYVEQVYMTTPYFEGRTLLFMRPSGEKLTFR